MTDDVTSITQEDVNTLLTRLKALRKQITDARAALAPLEEKLTLVFKDYQAVVGQLRREAQQLQAEIYVLRDQIEGVSRDRGIYTPRFDLEIPESRHGGEITPTIVDPEALDKDTLLEHLVRVLDPMLNSEDADLLAHMQGMCKNPTTRLIDVLEQLPWGEVWMVRGSHETLAIQYRRLSVWERSLANQLRSLSRETERLHKDSRYGLWEQYQKGAQAWQEFLQQAVKQQQEYKAELAEEVKRLRAEWTEMVERT